MATKDSILYLPRNIDLIPNDLLKELKEKNNIEEAINNLRPRIFWKDKAKLLNQSKKWNLSKIKEALNKVYDIEIQIKTKSYINHNLLLKKLILDLCILANS